jgi:hypothetical protein
MDSRVGWIVDTFMYPFFELGLRVFRAREKFTTTYKRYTRNVDPIMNAIFDCLGVDSTRMCARDKAVVTVFATILTATVLYAVASLAYIMILMLAITVLMLALLAEINLCMLILLEDRSILLRLWYTELQYCDFEA